MQRNGFSLVETAVVLGIVGVVLALALPAFSGYLRRYRSDAQTRLLFTELQQARAQAVYQRRTVRVKVCRDRFARYSSASDEEKGAQPVSVQPFAFPVVSNNPHGDAILGYIVDFEPTGVTSNNCSICLESGDAAGAEDSVVLSGTRVSLGKKDRGDDCTTDNITKH